ncbi:hypothetical protein [Noviherbaspirillum aridicola]|uniref:Uncharacterized protein n=1 Tax=Noviherbaspirillum aridicola TaxID=2849687 RepID=A0ABQ4QAI1_9BURK|nr:hypothetical protein [Noviherbaspirillum aridicola]GIZ53689.1 hypothetical protein NCCP691_37030 [Noviherbaspirillum aridicola]
MTRIAIKDLADSVELDHEAMTAISGGARIARQQPLPSPAGARRLTQFPWDIGISAPQDRRGGKTGTPSR